MSIAIRIRFPSGRYHATPWDHHVNEGMIEWPPSPWRLLRALIATWHLKANEILEKDVRLLVEQLGSVLPSYILPRAVASHTRHYMPVNGDSPPKVLDAFLHVAHGASLYVVWHCDLSNELREVLEVLVKKLGYLGRAESWIEAEVTDDTSDFVDGINVSPMHEKAGDDIVRLLAPMSDDEIARWREAAVDERITRALEQKRRRAFGKKNGKQEIKLTSREKHRLEAQIPSSAWSAIQIDTGALTNVGWSRPPGSRWVDYARPKDALTSAVIGRSSAIRSGPLTVARFAVASTVPPLLTEALSVADRVRTALLSRSNGSRVFLGRDSTGRLLSGHGHAFIIPEANGPKGNVTHVTIYAPMGFDDGARRALDSLRSVWGRADHALQLILLGVGLPEEFAGLAVGSGQCPLFATSSTWVSRTPFIATRHPKRFRDGRPKLDSDGRSIGSPEHDLVRLLQASTFPAPLRIEPVDSTRLGGKETRWITFRAERYRGHGARGSSPVAGFRLIFHEPVTGPIAVGYGAHFGLGVFVPESN